MARSESRVFCFGGESHALSAEQEALLREENQSRESTVVGKGVAVIRALPLAQRTATELHMVQGRTVGYAADQLGLRRGYTKRLIRDAVANVRRVRLA